MATLRALLLMLVALVVLAAACGDDDTSTTATPTTTDMDEPALVDAESPVGGTVKQLVIPGPETSVLVACDQEGFEPFLFSDQGSWVGCELGDGATPGAASPLTEPILDETSSPVGGIVKLVTIPGPELSMLVACDEEGFEPFLFSDEGTWVGCTT